MRKKLTIFKALITGDASIEHIDKTSIRRTPGDVTEVSHQWVYWCDTMKRTPGDVTEEVVLTILN